MEKIRIKDLEYTYGANEEATLSNISLEISDGDFVVLFGKSGCGKTTLLKNLKNELRPHGKLKGEILLDGKNILDIDTSTKIGFVMQNPDNQIVTDKVWHELSFGLENLNIKPEEIRARVSEIASFFNIQNLFYEDVSKLSGGQKQILNLASVMVMNPEVLILDEPTSRLDPIAAEEFIKVLKKINDEFRNNNNFI